MEKNNFENCEKYKYKISCDIEVAFARLIGPLSIMSVLDSYKEASQEIKKILGIIINWGAIFQKKRNLHFISSEELLNIYYRLNDLKDEYLYNDKIGDESELSDEVVIWMWELMELRKKLIELDGES